MSHIRPMRQIPRAQQRQLQAEQMDKVIKAMAAHPVMPQDEKRQALEFLKAVADAINNRTEDTVVECIEQHIVMNSRINR
jgi:glycerol-3-phosphate cytidylyltransferase-like family protein